MATHAENYDLQCVVCTEILRDARLLRCGHHFCRVCLEQIADRQPKGTVPCPTCRHVTDIQEEVGVEGLPRYAATSEFSKRVTDALERQGESVQPRICDVCGKDEAEEACLSCCLSFCKTCKKKHSNMEDIGSAHKLFPISQYMFCSTHATKSCQTFCTKCNEICCPLCIIDFHEGHKLEDLTGKSNEIRASLTWRVEKMNTAKMETCIADNLKGVLETSVNIKRIFHGEIFQLKANLKELFNKVNTMEQELGVKLEANIKLLKAMNADMDDYLGSKMKLKGHLTYLIEKACDAEVVKRESEVPGYEKDAYKHIVTTAEVQLPDVGTTYITNKALAKVRQKLECGYKAYSLLTVREEDLYDYDFFDSHYECYDDFDDDHDYRDQFERDFDDLYGGKNLLVS